MCLPLRLRVICSVSRRLDRRGKPLIERMVRIISECTAIESEKVSLQIVKAILALGTSSLRACYNIFLSTKKWARTSTCRPRPRRC